LKPEELKYSDSVKEVIEEIDKHSLSYALDVASQYGVEVEYYPLDQGLYRIFDMKIRSGYFSPSMFSTYFYCARRMWLSKIHGDIVDSEGLKRIIRGKVAQELWLQEHRLFMEEYEIVDGEEKIHGYIDAVVVMEDKAVIVELKTAHRTTLGHRLQVMLYKKIFEKTHSCKRVDAYLVFRHGVKTIEVREDLLERYMRRVKAVLESDLPPPKLPEEKYCPSCPYRYYCEQYPVIDWDEWLVGVVGDLPKGEKCRSCEFLYSCREYRGKTGRYPCEVNQQILVRSGSRG